MKLLTRLCLVLMVATAAGACKHNKHATTTVKERAMFDLSCPEQDLDLSVLDTDGARKLSTQIGVRGCGQKAVYVYYPDSDTWVIDGAVSPMEEGFDFPSQATKTTGKRRSDKRAAKAERKGKMNDD